jgi:hypothetical protein
MLGCVREQRVLFTVHLVLQNFRVLCEVLSADSSMVLIVSVFQYGEYGEGVLVCGWRLRGLGLGLGGRVRSLLLCVGVSVCRIMAA